MGTEVLITSYGCSHVKIGRSHDTEPIQAVLRHTGQERREQSVDGATSGLSVPVDNYGLSR